MEFERDCLSANILLPKAASDKQYLLALRQLVYTYLGFPHRPSDYSPIVVTSYTDYITLPTQSVEKKK